MSDEVQLPNYFSFSGHPMSYKIKMIIYASWYITVLFLSIHAELWKGLKWKHISGTQNANEANLKLGETKLES